MLGKKLLMQNVHAPGATFKCKFPKHRLEKYNFSGNCVSGNRVCGNCVSGRTPVLGKNRPSDFQNQI